MSVVKINLDGLRRFRSLLDRDLRGSSNGPIRAAFRQWAARFRSFVQERFVAKGGGDWLPLSPETLARRRGGGVDAAILRDTDTLFMAMTPAFGRPGGIQEDVSYGITVGYGGPARHPKGKATIADIAHFHQSVGGNLPVRKIIVPPNQHVQDQMAADMERAIRRLGEETKL